MSAKPVYEFDYTSTPYAVTNPTALNEYLYWYDTDTDLNSENVYYDAGDNYAIWTNASAKTLITAVSDVDGSPTDKFEPVPHTFTASGATS